MTIRTRLVLWYSLLVVAIMVLLGFVQYAGQKRLLQDQKDFSIKVIANILVTSLPERIPAKNDIQHAVSNMTSNYPDMEMKGVIIEVYTPTRTLIYSSSLSEEERLPFTGEMHSELLLKRISLVTIFLRGDSAPVRVLSKAVYHNQKLVYFIQAGISTQDINDALKNTIWLNVFFIPVIALIISTGGWFLAKKALIPLHMVMKAANDIGSGSLRRRVEVAYASKEISDLAASFNQMLDRLETSFCQIKDFTDNVSHELRIPLSILKGQTELSLRRERTSDEYRKVLESNMEEIERMEEIVEKLLFLSRAEQGEISLNYSTIDIVNILKMVYTRFLLLSHDRDIKLSINPIGPVFIAGDELLLYDVFQNLVQNGIKFTKAGGDVAIRIEKKDKSVIIDIADTGCGIPESDIPNIFDRFYQVDKSRSGKGSGLGLSICRWIVEAHRGRITTRSAVGHGSTFTVILPVND